MGSEMCIRDSYDGIDTSLIEGRDILLEFHSRVSSIPEIYSRYKDMTEDSIRWVYCPDAFTK